MKAIKQHYLGTVLEIKGRYATIQLESIKGHNTPYIITLHLKHLNIHSLFTNKIKIGSKLNYYIYYTRKHKEPKRYYTKIELINYPTYTQEEIQQAKTEAKYIHDWLTGLNQYKTGQAIKIPSTINTEDEFFTWLNNLPLDNTDKETTPLLSNVYTTLSNTQTNLTLEASNILEQDRYELYITPNSTFTNILANTPVLQITDKEKESLQEFYNNLSNKQTTLGQDFKKPTTTELWNSFE